MTLPGRILRVKEDVLDRPVFILTSDVDWASDYCIDAFLSFARGHGITPTLFVTHDSLAIDALKTDGRVELGIHPNFLPGSTHGGDVGAVLDSMLSIVSEPVAVRNHHYVESTEISRLLAARGLRVDSNLCLFLQPHLAPLHHWSGGLRLPCFWEDDVHWERGFDWNLERYRSSFLTPGLKILNVHPFNFALNVPGAEFYAANHHHIRTLDEATADRLRFVGPGAATFLGELVQMVRSEGFRFTTIGGLVEALAMERATP